MKKLLYVAPHLSTGGLPQYLVKKVELLKDEFEIYVVEWVNHTGGVLVVQRDKILNLVDPDKFFELGEDKMKLIDIINEVQPDIVHLEEIPEFFMDFEVAKKIYTKDRNYIIVETSHDSSYDTTQKRFLPDKFMFVSDWQIKQYENIDIPKVLVEYPIEYIDRPNREEALRKLGLNPQKKHVLHVGLFTPRKNQAEFFEYARSLPEVEFHCVGNQAQNFKFYWEPLMKDKPDNVTWWNERTDVDNFYQSMDLFLFTSRGTNNDKETMPLVIREALSYQIPVLIYNLPVYLNYFDKFDGLNYLEFDNFDKNCNIILENLELQQRSINPEEEAIIISTYPVTDSVISTTKECIQKAKQTGRKVILTSHAPIPEELQEEADYCVYDKNNILTKHTFFSNSWWDSPEIKVDINLRAHGNDVYHGPAVYTNYYNGTVLADKLGFKKVFFLNFDYLIKNGEILDTASRVLETKNTYLYHFNEIEGPCVITWFMGIRPKFFLDTIPAIHTAKDYDDLVIKFSSESNTLENLWCNAFFKKDNIFYIKDDTLQRDLATKELLEKYIEFRDFSRVEYFTILPTTKGNFAPYLQITNSKDSRKVIIQVKENDEIIFDTNFEVTNRITWFEDVSYNVNNHYTVTMESYDLVTGKLVDSNILELDKEYLLNVLPNNGLINYKNHKNIKLMHLVTEPETNEKEIRSIENIKDFCNKTGITYEQRINKIWTETPPKDTCNRPNDVQDVPGYYKLAPGHYGCYKAHTDAILAEDNSNYDYVLVFEGDVIVESDYNELFESLKRFSRLANEQDQDIIGFGNPWKNRNLNGPKIEDIYTDVTPFIPAQSYLINNNKLDKIKLLITTTPWDAFDMWVCNVARLRVGTAEKIYTKHLPGFSIIEQEFKGMDENSPEIYAAE